MKRNQPSEGHLLPGDDRRRNLSGLGNKPTEQGALTPWRRQGKGLVRTRKEIDRVRGTHLLETTREGLVRTQKEIDRVRGTHKLETAEGGTRQAMERNRQSEAHSLSGDGRGRDLLGHGKKSTEGGTLTPWRRWRERLVRTRKEVNRVRDTHLLDTAEGGTCQDTERNRPSEGHSLPGDGRGWDLSGNGKEPPGQGELTFWRRQREGLVRTRKQTHRSRGTHKLETAA